MLKKMVLLLFVLVPFTGCSAIYSENPYCLRNQVIEENGLLVGDWKVYSNSNEQFRDISISADEGITGYKVLPIDSKAEKETSYDKCRFQLFEFDN